jgi:hypothetical protein
VNWKSALALAVFVALTSILATHHEPWRDEADAWVMARDASVGEILHYGGYSGTPGLWYFIQMPFAKTGAGYATQRYLHLVIAWVAAGLLLFCAPFPLGLRLALVFGYFLSFEYAVISRNYAIGILLCFTALAMDGARRRLAPLYGVVVGLAANASAHFTFFALAFAAALAWDAWRARGNRRLWLGVALAGAGIGLAVWQLWPPVDGQLPPEFFRHVEPLRIRETLSQAFVPHHAGFWTEVVGALAVGLTLARVRAAPRAALVFLLTSAGLFYVLVFKYAGGVRHFGLLFIAVTVAWWMAGAETPGPGRSLRQRVLAAALGVLLLPSLLVAAHTWVKEMRDDYSEAGEMARFILENRLDRAWVAAHSAAPAVSVLAFLPRRTFWYPGIDENGSYMKWDARYDAARKVPLSEVIARVKTHRPDWRAAADPTYLLLSRPWPEAEAEGFRLLFRTPGRPWGARDETFYLYAPDPGSS